MADLRLDKLLFSSFRKNRGYHYRATTNIIKTRKKHRANIAEHIK